jgi:hypothetical protein
MRARETLLSLVKALQKTLPVAATAEAPKAADFAAWFPLIADHFARGPRNERVRGYLKAAARETWQLVNWLTHTSKANLHEARFALQATSNLLTLTTTAVMQAEGEAPRTCPECESYRMTLVHEPDMGLDPPYVSLCESCGWNNAPAVVA